MPLFTQCPRMSRPNTGVGYYANNSGVKVLTPFSSKKYKRILRHELKQGCEIFITWVFIVNYSTKCITVIILILRPITLLSERLNNTYPKRKKEKDSQQLLSGSNVLKKIVLAGHCKAKPGPQLEFDIFNHSLFMWPHILNYNLENINAISCSYYTCNFSIIFL